MMATVIFVASMLVTVTISPATDPVRVTFVGAAAHPWAMVPPSAVEAAAPEVSVT